MMQLVLIQDVPKLGRKYEVVKVRDGYAMNFLLPKGFAEPATAGRVKEATKRLEQVLIQKERIHEKAEEIKEMLEKTGKITIPAKVTDKETLYAAITEKDVSEVIEKVANVRLEKKHLKLEDHIKHLGEYAFIVKLAEDVKVEMTLEVVAEG